MCDNFALTYPVTILYVGGFHIGRRLSYGNYAIIDKHYSLVVNWKALEITLTWIKIHPLPLLAL